MWRGRTWSSSAWDNRTQHRAGWTCDLLWPPSKKTDLSHSQHSPWMGILNWTRKLLKERRICYPTAIYPGGTYSDWVSENPQDKHRQTDGGKYRSTQMFRWWVIITYLNIFPSCEIVSQCGVTEDRLLNDMPSHVRLTNTQHSQRTQHEKTTTRRHRKDQMQTATRVNIRRLTQAGATSDGSWSGGSTGGVSSDLESVLVVVSMRWIWYKKKLHKQTKEKLSQNWLVI